MTRFNFSLCFQTYPASYPTQKMAPPNNKLTKIFHRLDCPAQRDWRDLLWQPWSLVKQCSAQTLATFISFVRNGRRKYTITATTAPRTIIFLVGGTLLWAVPNQALFCHSGFCSEVSASVEESRTGSSVFSSYFVWSLMTMKTGSQTL